MLSNEHIEEIINIAAGFRKGLLKKRQSKAMCFFICVPLQAYLSISGFETELIEGEIKTEEGIWNHYLLKLPDERILDPTAA